MLSRSLAAAALAALLALPACKKNKPTAPDTAPPPDPVPNPNKDPRGTDPNDQAPAPAGAGLPTFPYPNRPIYSAVSGAPFRAASRASLQQIGLAFHNALDASGKFPAGIADQSGKVGLSWRVALLPYLEHENLYRQFKLDEPWDGEHNRKLIPQMPKVFSPPRTDTNGYTFYRSFAGPNTVMPPAPKGAAPGKPVFGVGVPGIPDGTANTLLAAEAYDPVIWTKPDELPLAPGKPPKMGGVFAGGFNALFCDGAVRFLPINLPPKTLENVIQTNDGNIVDLP
jgi:prepilin-type processing-associated H-X9-DG protein